LDAQLNPREIIERKRRAFEEKYGDKLKERVQAWVPINLRSPV
jgi:ATP synthase F1 complex assembly factor 1